MSYYERLPDAEASHSELLLGLTFSCFEKEIDRADLGSAKLELVSWQPFKAVSLAMVNVIPFLQERLTRDVLLNNETMTDRRIFYALRKLLEFVGVVVDRTSDMSMPNASSKALYRGFHSTVHTFSSILIIPQQFRNFCSSAEQGKESFEHSILELDHALPPPGISSNQSNGDTNAILGANEERHTIRHPSLATNRQADGHGISHRY